MSRVSGAPSGWHDAMSDQIERSDVDTWRNAAHLDVAAVKSLPAHVRETHGTVPCDSRAAACAKLLTSNAVCVHIPGGGQGPLHSIGRAQQSRLEVSALDDCAGAQGQAMYRCGLGAAAAGRRPEDGPVRCRACVRVRMPQHAGAASAFQRHWNHCIARSYHAWARSMHSAGGALR